EGGGVGGEPFDGGVLAGLVVGGGGLGVGDEGGDVVLGAPQAVEGGADVLAVHAADGGDEVGGVARLGAVQGRGGRLELRGPAVEGGVGGAGGQPHVLPQERVEPGP